MPREPALVELALAWTAWCFLHSLLIARGVRAWFRARLGRWDRVFRLLYNLVAFATFAAVYLWSLRLDGPEVFTWWGAWPAVSAALLAGSLLLFAAGARVYDLGEFLGLEQLSGGRKGPGIGGGGGITRAGVLGVVRHPWYTAGVMILWVGPKTAPDLVTGVVLSLYLVVGAFMEERKLVAEFGDAYRRYRGEVSMFLPFRWLRRRLGGSGHRGRG